MRLFFALVTLGLAAIILSGLGLAWDGGYQLFNILERQTADAGYGRFSQSALFALVLGLSHLTNQVPLLAGAFSAVHAVLTLLALAGAWLIARTQARTLFIYPALGITLVTLPGQACLVCQGTLAVQLFWVLFIALLVGAARRLLPLLALLILFIIFLHPVASVLLAFGAAAAVVAALANRHRRGELFGWSAVLAVATVAALVRFALFQGAYERETLNWLQLETAYRMAFAGLPAKAWLLTVLAALCARLAVRILHARRVLEFAALGGVLAAVLLLTSWMSGPSLWYEALRFRFLALFLSLPLFALAVWESLAPPPDPARAWAFRRRLIPLAAAGFALVLIVQSLVWFNLNRQLQTALASSPETCIDAGSIPTLNDTALDHWSITAHSLLAQGWQPTKIVLAEVSCDEANFDHALFVARFTEQVWDFQDWSRGWFDKHLLKAELGQTPCEFTTGWHSLQMKDSGWSRVFDRRAELRISAPQASRAALTASLSSFGGDKELTLRVNGSELGRWLIQAEEPNPLSLIELPLQRGDNLIEWETRSLEPLPDDYEPGVAVQNLKLTAQDGMLLCK